MKYSYSFQLGKPHSDVYYCKIVTSFLRLSSNTMDVEMRSIIMFLSMFKMLVSAQTFKGSVLEQQKILKDNCDSLVVSPLETDEGRSSLVGTYFFQYPFFRFRERYNQV